MLGLSKCARSCLATLLLLTASCRTLNSQQRPIVQETVRVDEFEDDFVTDNYVDLQGDISLLDINLTIDIKYKEALYAIFYKKKRKFVNSSIYRQHRLSLLAYIKTLRAYNLVIESDSLYAEEKEYFESILLRQLKTQRRETLVLLKKLLTYEKSLLQEILDEFEEYVNYHETA
jgi:hypothetical protein